MEMVRSSSGSLVPRYVRLSMIVTVVPPLLALLDQRRGGRRGCRCGCFGGYRGVSC